MRMGMFVIALRDGIDMITKCKNCDKRKKIYAKQLCMNCYQKIYQNTYHKAYQKKVWEDARAFRKLKAEGKI